MASHQQQTTNPLASQVDHHHIVGIATQIRERTAIRPRIGIICGSGLGGLAEQLDTDKPSDEIPYEEIGFPKCSVQGHAGKLVFGYLASKPVMCMQGRLHYYEGHHLWQITKPIRTMKELGIEILIVTNAAGGLNPQFSIGDIMLMKDHINLAGMSGQNPLMGPNEDRHGPRFPAMSTAYDKDLRDLVSQTAKEINMQSFLQEGVYVHVTGPNYETPSESRFLRMCGADAVGMSTAPEVVVARHAGIRVLGISLITNVVIMDHDSDHTPPSHQEVMETSQRRAEDLQKLVKYAIGRMQ